MQEEVLFFSLLLALAFSFTLTERRFIRSAFFLITFFALSQIHFVVSCFISSFFFYCQDKHCWFLVNSLWIFSHFCPFVNRNKVFKNCIPFPNRWIFPGSCVFGIFHMLSQIPSHEDEAHPNGSTLGQRPTEDTHGFFSISIYLAISLGIFILLPAPLFL